MAYLLRPAAVQQDGIRRLQGDELPAIVLLVYVGSSLNVQQHKELHATMVLLEAWRVEARLVAPGEARLSDQLGPIHGTGNFTKLTWYAS